MRAGITAASFALPHPQERRAMSDPSIQTSPSAGAPADPSIQATPPLSDAAPPTNAPGARRALFIVFLVVVIDLLGFGIVLPLLPRYGEVYVTQYLDPMHQAAAHHDWRVGAIAGTVLAALLAIFSLMQFVFAPVWGLVSDRVGRRPVLLIGLAGSVLFYALFGYASDLPAAEWAGLALLLLFVSRLGAGVAGATIATAQAVIADSTRPEKRKHGMALIGMAFGVGFTFGPLVAVASLYWAPPGFQGVVGYCAAVLSLVALVLGFVLLPETRRFGAAPPLKRKLFDWQATLFALASRAVGPVVLAFFLTTLGFAMFEVTLSLLFKHALDISDKNNGLLFAYVGLVLALAQGVLYRRLAKHVSEVTFMAAGMVLMGAGVASLAGVNALANAHVLGFGGMLALVMIALTVAVVGFSLLTPSATALVSRRSDPEKQGVILGVNQSASAMARILGPIISLPLYFLTADHLLPYLVGGALTLGMLLLIPRIRSGEGIGRSALDAAARLAADSARLPADPGIQEGQPPDERIV
jgi:MFS family permease